VEALEGRALLSGGPTIYTVNSVDNGATGTGTSGTLPYVISQANANSNPAGSRIEFDPTVFSSPQTIALASTLELSETAGPEVIVGPGSGVVTISGGNAVRVVQVDSGVTATLSGLTISDGNASSGPGTDGGGVENTGTLNIADSTISGCSARNGGGIDSDGTLSVTTSTIAGNTSLRNLGGGIHNSGTMNITASTITNNSVPDSNDGGGIDNSGTMNIIASTISGNSAPYGGGIYNDGTMTITDSTIAKNSSTSFGGGILNTAALTIINSTISDNTSRVGGGGIYNSRTLTIINSTISGNSSIGEGGGIDDYGTITITSSTIAYNNVATQGLGGGLRVTYQGTATLFNTIVALNTATGGGGATADDISVGVGELSPASASNLIGIGGAGGLTNDSNGNLVGVADPGLGGLADNGGPTQTIALLAGSPAIGAGNVTLAVDPATNLPLATDQRGPGFPRRVYNLVDIGAYQLQPASPAAIQLVVTEQPTGAITAGASFDFTVASEDPSGNIDSSFHGTVNVALAQQPRGRHPGRHADRDGESGGGDLLRPHAR
jgi:hypothetical protein